MAKDNNQSLSALESDKVHQVVCNLYHLVNDIFTLLLHQRITRRSILYIEQTSLFVASVARNLRSRLPPDPAQPTHLGNGQPIDFSQLQ